MKNLFAVIIAMVVFGANGFAEDGKNSDGMTVREKKTIRLTLGNPQDEKLEEMPKGITFKGDFKKFTKVQYSEELNTLRFDPIATGIATLTIHDKKGKVIAEYSIDVKKSKLDAIANEIQNLLGDIEGISIKIINNRVVVDGQILLPRDMNRVLSVVRQYGDVASSLVTLSPLAQKKIAELIEKDIGNPEIHVRAVNEKFLLEGVAGSPDERARAEILAKTYVPDVIVEDGEAMGIVKKRKVDTVINMITVKESAPPPPGKMIQVVVHYVELNKNYLNGFRFQWMPSLDDGSKMQFTSDSRAPGGVVSTLTGIISNLLPKLNWAKQHGHARVLQSSSIIVQDGKKGEIKSTSNMPYQTATKDGLVTAFVEVGLKTVVTPQILGARSDSISLELDFGVSSLVDKTAGPMTASRNINTVVIIRSGQSAAVGGLITSEQSTGYNKLPPSGPQNPIVSIYASKDFQRNQSQFVVFVTPIIKSSASAGAEKIKQKFRLRE